MKVVLITNTETGTTVLASPCPDCSALVTDDLRDGHQAWHDKSKQTGAKRYIISVERELNTPEPTQLPAPEKIDAVTLEGEK